MNETKYTFDNIEALQRNREIEGEAGTEIGLPGGITLTVLAASDANPRWEARREKTQIELRRLNNANASAQRKTAFLARVYAECLMKDWRGVKSGGVEIPFSVEACTAFLQQCDDAFLAIDAVVYDTKMFRGERIAVAVELGKA